MLQILVTISQKFCCRKETWAMQNLFIKKKKKKKKNDDEELKKMDTKVSEIFKTIGTQMPA